MTCLAVSLCMLSIVDNMYVTDCRRYTQRHYHPAATTTTYIQLTTYIHSQSINHRW
jgi:hypothetical protein